MIIYWIIIFASVSIVIVFFQGIKHKKRDGNLKLKIMEGSLLERLKAC